MTVLEAILLGAVQGLTEFLPVSSSGHLVLAQALFGLVDVPLLFDVILHIATLAAVVIVFRTRLLELLGAVVRFATRRTRPQDYPLLTIVAMLLTATVITAVIGIGLKEVLRVRSPRFTAVMFLVTAFILTAGSWLSERRSGQSAAVPLERVGLRRTIIVGVAQGIGVLPGVSRSGITISAGLLSGLDRRAAGEFSFLLSIPAILGALVLELRHGVALAEAVGSVALAAGFISAALVGLAALQVLLRIVRAGRLHWFALYLVPLALWGLWYF